ncbi:transposase family protein [Thalassomonas viridans]|uniref:Transposase family protein n=1 Tax=Thalassomonas viridans TaxID=137584 RepID=A0AAF0C920_9GAMM|nr:integrase core domain-containing protein [Thalassomonas viridans]WDE07032.1 transposase family protein [Thalassomonas viridans]
MPDKQTPPVSFARNRKKPQWVVDKVLYLKAVSGTGCGSVAQLFNQRYGHKTTVSKSFVYEKLKANQYQLQVVKRKIKQKPARSVPVNHTWGIDLTKIKLSRKQKTVLGIIEHGSRVNLALSELPSKHSAQLLLALCRTIRHFGLPNAIRTDNEACFTSLFFTTALKLLGIKHQTTHLASPWENGRIERFFGTFKNKIRQLDLSGFSSLQHELDRFRFWYNHIRPHQNLAGYTPMEVWRNKANRHSSKAVWVNDWQGLLTGYYFPS